MKIYLVTVLILVCALIFVSGEGGNSNSTSEDDPNASPDSGSNKGSDSDNEHDTNETKPCLCPKIMQRVCGTNGRAYNNICLLLCNNDDVNIECMGECEHCTDETRQNGCFVPGCCRSDGETVSPDIERRCRGLKCTDCSEEEEK